MSGHEVGTAATRRQRVKPRIGTRGGLPVLQCLVVSANPHRRELLASSAVEEGWRPLVCAGAGRARTLVRRTVTRLILVDLVNRSGRSPRRLREWVASVSRVPDVLMVVCGRQADRDEEVWARRLGVWLYLPGVSPGDDMRMICRQAMQIVDRQMLRSSRADMAM